MIACPQLGTWGRLGNQLWEIAGTAGIANAWSDVPAFPNTWKYQDVFQVPTGLFHPPSALCNMQDVVHAPQLEHIDPKYRGYMQDMGLWADIAPMIGQWFSQSAMALHTMHARYGWFYELPRPICGVHVRRGDYVPLPWHFPAPPLRYYEEQVAALAPQSVVVFSDDILWCRTYLRFPRLTYYFRGGKVMPKEHEPEYATAIPTDWHDFLALSHCDSFVLSNSTFGWWAAYLSGSEQVVYPEPWYGEAFPDIDVSLMFSQLPKWVPCAY